MNRNSSADEHSRGQGSKALAAAAAGRVLACVKPDHHTTLFQILKMLLQIATEPLKREKTEQSIFKKKCIYSFDFTFMEENSNVRLLFQR